MLNSGVRTGRSVGNKGDQERPSRFSHLVGTAVPSQAAVASCVYFDGIAEELPVSRVLDLIESWFSLLDKKPAVVLVKAANGRTPRFTVKSLRERAALGQTTFDGSFETIQFFPKGRTTIDDTWRPSAYFAISVRRPASAFFCVNSDFSALDLISFLITGDELFRSCASYGFWFPERFSPLGYYWGIAVEPSDAGVGAWGKRELSRISHWRDNASIGIASNTGRSVFGACDGFVRDAYPLMLLGPNHLSRKINGVPLRDRLLAQELGDSRPVGGKYLVSVPTEKLAVAQEMLDVAGISQSGRRFEGIA